MNAKPPLASGEPEIDYYPLPGTEECENHLFCKKQFHNSASRCPAFNPHLDCTGLPYVVNASTPMGFWRHTIKLTAIDGETPICKLKAGSGPTPGVWKNPQEDFVPIDFWWEMLDVHRENVCDYVKMMYAPDPQNPMDLVEGESKYCSEVCWKDFSWSLEDRDQPCDEPQKPCKTLSEYMSHPLPRKNWYASRSCKRLSDLHRVQGIWRYGRLQGRRIYRTCWTWPCYGDEWSMGLP